MPYPTIFSNDSAIDFKFKKIANSIFDFLDNLMKKQTSLKETAEISRIAKQLQEQKKFDYRDPKKTTLLPPSSNPDPPHRTPIASTFSGLGICVPFDKKTKVGYRPVPISEKELKSLFETMRNTPKEKRDTRRIEEVLNWVNIGNDECDFGQGLEFGLNLFCGDKPGEEQVFGKIASVVLKNAYKLLARGEFTGIVDGLITQRRAVLDRHGRDDRLLGGPIALKR